MNTFEQDEVTRLEEELSTLNRRKNELVESSRGCFLFCYRIFRPFQVFSNLYRWDRQVLCSKIAPWQNSSPGFQNSSPECQKRPFCFKVNGAILELRGAILQSRGVILPGAILLHRT